MLQCEGPVSTRDSSCHTASDVTGPRDSDFQVKGYTFSEPFHLTVSYDWLILQSPAMPMFEGDPLVLRCQAWQDWPLTQVTFYRDGAALGPPRAQQGALHRCPAEGGQRPLPLQRHVQGPRAREPADGVSRGRRRPR